MGSSGRLKGEAEGGAGCDRDERFKEIAVKGVRRFEVFVWGVVSCRKMTVSKRNTESYDGINSRRN